MSDALTEFKERSSKNLTTTYEGAVFSITPVEGSYQVTILPPNGLEIRFDLPINDTKVTWAK